MCEILCELLEALLTTRCGRSALCSHTRQRLDEVPTAKLQEDLGVETGLSEYMDMYDAITCRTMAMRQGSSLASVFSRTAEDVGIDEDAYFDAKHRRLERLLHGTDDPSDEEQHRRRKRRGHHEHKKRKEHKRRRHAADASQSSSPRRRTSLDDHASAQLASSRSMSPTPPQPPPPPLPPPPPPLPP